MAELFSERMCRHFREDFGLETRVAPSQRLRTAWNLRGRPREGARGDLSQGRRGRDGERTGDRDLGGWTPDPQLLLHRGRCRRHPVDPRGDYPDPVNLGSSELVTIDQLVDVVEEIAGVKLERIYDPSAPTGVRGRNSDNSLIKREFGWVPSTPLAIGMEKTYAWIYDQLAGMSSDRSSIR